MTGYQESICASSQLSGAVTTSTVNSWNCPTNSGRSIAAHLHSFQPISLADMEDVALLNRTDTKYVMGESHLDAILASLAADYRVLTIGGVRLHRYRTLYFDTAEFAFYRRHHSGARNRYKVRSRKYLDSGQSFLEVKFKSSKERTIKYRLPTAELMLAPTAETEVFFRQHLPLDSQFLLPVIENSFSRLTLVGKKHPERLTLDLNLCFWGDNGAVALPGLVVAEVKQDGVNRGSPFMQQMRERRIRPTRFSKYCTAVSLLYPHLKSNNFKPQRRLIQQLIRGESHVHRGH